MHSTLILGYKWPCLCATLGRAELITISAHHYLRSLLCLSLEWHPSSSSIIVHHHHWLSAIDPVDWRGPLGGGIWVRNTPLRHHEETPLIINVTAEPPIIVQKRLLLMDLITSHALTTLFLYIISN